jgi:predicted alpha/beta superfamily hydrolase
MKEILSCLLLFLAAFASVAQTNGPLVQFGERHMLHSKILKEDRQYWIYLPPSYAPDPDRAPKKYPVLYLTDGDWNFDWACEVAQFMGDTLEIPELIVVGIPNIDRGKDLTPTHATNIVSSGGGPLFEKFLSKELAPEVEAKFRTAPYRILLGHSLGGVLVVDSFLRQTNGFQGYIAIDPSLWWDNRIMVQRAREFSPRTNSHAAMFIAEANWPHNLADWTNSNKYASDLFLSALKTNSPDVRVGCRFFELEDHGSSRLMGLYDGLRFIFEDYKPTNFYALNEPALLEDHFKKISDRLGFQILPPEGYVNKIGDSLSDPAHADKAIECFKLNVVNYPVSAGVYRHLGDAYVVKGDKELAVQNYRQALELDPNMSSAKTALENLK